jgi:hypothetical protein
MRSFSADSTVSWLQQALSFHGWHSVNVSGYGGGEGG